MIARRLVLGLSASLLAAACGGGPGPTPSAGGRQGIPASQLTPASAATLPTPPPAPAQPHVVAMIPKEPEPGPPLAAKSYEVKGRRDPFVVITLPKPKELKAGIDVATFKLAGVIQGGNRLALLEAPDGVGYIMKAGEMLGDARITEIGATSVTFAVDTLGAQHPSNVTLRLKTD
jgi:hypothetical protein